MLKIFARAMLFCMVFVFSVFAETYNAVLFSWDGAQRLHVEELLSAGKLPAIKMLKDSGAFVKIEVKDHGTVTSAGHAQMLTGLPPKINKVVGNERWEPIPEGYTIFEKLENGLGKDNIITVMVMGKKGYMGAKSAEDLKDVKAPKYLKKGEPYYNVKKKLDVWDGDQIRGSEEVTPRALEYIERFKDKRFFMFCHFADPDTSGHGFGENSKEYEEALITCDANVGKIINKLKEINVYDKTLVYVTADHGFDEGKDNHSNAPDIFLATNDKAVKKNGTQADITPTILFQFGINISKLEPPLPGTSLNK